jgi:hypothetical protein
MGYDLHGARINQVLEGERRGVGRRDEGGRQRGGGNGEERGGTWMNEESEMRE